MNGDALRFKALLQEVLIVSDERPSYERRYSSLPCASLTRLMPSNYCKSTRMHYGRNDLGFLSAATALHHSLVSVTPGVSLTGRVGFSYFTHHLLTSF